MIITIDGPAGTGKTTIAKLVAKKLDFNYFDTGAMYRAITYQILEKKVSYQNFSHLQEVLKDFHFSIKKDQGKFFYFVDDIDVTEKIRESRINLYVSDVSALGPVREKLVDLQRKLGEKDNAVFEGRDMGSVVFPQAAFKFFLTATEEIRAKRRYLELQAKYPNATLEEVMKQLHDRDLIDSTREISPLIQAKDAHLIDTSYLTIDEVVDSILHIVEKKK